MKSERINQWLTLGANLGVLVGIALLLVELQQNHELNRAQTRSDLTTSLTNILLVPADNLQLSSAIRRWNAGEEISADEQQQVMTYTNALFRYWENVYYQYHSGLYDELEFDAHRAAIQESMRASSVARRYWCSYGPLYSSKFKEEIDRHVDAQECSALLSG